MSVSESLKSIWGWILRNRVWLGVLLTVLGIIVAGAMGLIPAWGATALIVITFMSIPGAISGAVVIKWLHQIRWVHLVDLDATTNDFAVYKLSPDAWADLDVQDGELNPVNAKFRCFVGRDFDRENMTVDGTWRGSADDLELIEERERIREIRQELQQMAQQGLAHRIREGTIVRQALRDIVGQVARTTEQQTLVNGQAVEQAVEDALEDWSVEKEEPEDVEDGPDVTEDVDGQQAAETSEEVTADD